MTSSAVSPDVFATVLADPLAPSRTWARQGERVIGCLDNYVPEELVHAAGLRPIRLLGSPDNVDLAASALPVFAGKLARSILEQGLRGDLAHLTGLALSNSSDAVRMLHELWRRHLPGQWIALADVPAVLEGETNHAVFREAMLAFKEALEQLAGKPLIPDVVSASAAVFDDNRRLLRQAAALLAARRLCGETYLDAVLAGFAMTKESHSEALRVLLAGCPREPDPATSALVPVHMSGPLLVDRSFLPLLRECGATMVSEDLGTGTRYFRDSVDVAGDPIDAVIERYWRKVPDSYKAPMEPRWRHLVECLERSQARGVIFVIEKFSDEDEYDYPVWRDRLLARGVPSLLLGTEIAVEGEQVRTRVQTFVDIVRDGAWS